MDFLAGRKTAGRLAGDVRVNGHPQDFKTFARVSGYCEQFDIHSPQVGTLHLCCTQPSLAVSYEPSTGVDLGYAG